MVMATAWKNLISLDEIKKLPKLELHAHINGSVRLSYLKDIVSDSLPVLPPTNSPSKLYFEFMGKIQNLVSTPDRLRHVLVKIIEDFIEDGVIYLELRSGPRKTNYMDKKKYIETILSVLEDFNTSGRIIVRFLLSVKLDSSLPEMIENADLAIKYSKEHPCIVGVDLSGNFHQSNLEENLKVLKKCKERGLKISCHIAEEDVICNETLPILELIKPARLGHATKICPNSQEGLLVQSYGPLIECCLTSNVLTGSVAEYSKHHARTWFDINHPICLCTDDVGTFDTTLSLEYLKAMENLQFSVADLARINIDAVDHIFDDSVKKEVKRLLTNF